MTFVRQPLIKQLCYSYFKESFILSAGAVKRKFSLFNVFSKQNPIVSACEFNNYEYEKQNFKIDVPEYYNFATDVIDKWADEEKRGRLTDNEKLALWLIDDESQNTKEYKWSFQELAMNSKRTANVLQHCCNVKKGDRIIVLLPRMVEWWLINIACIRIGAVLIPGTTQLTSRDILQRLQRSKAKCIVSNADTAVKIDEVISDCPLVQTKVLVAEQEKPSWLHFNSLYEEADTEHQAVKSKSNEPMTIFFTSGTTGNPKMTEHTHVSYGLACLITGKYWLDLIASDIHWNISDPGWAKSAWSNIFAPWIRGACVFIYNSKNFDARRILKVLQDYPISTFCTAPTAYRMMVLENLKDYKVNSYLRHCVSAGEPLNKEVIETWEKAIGLTIREGYGQTETVLQVGSFRCIPNKPGSMGKPAPGMDVRVIDDNGAETADGVEGDIAVKIKPNRPVGLFSRYVDDPELTASTITGDYYVTGDRAVRDEEGYLWFVGRGDDVIISSGYRIGPFEVESALIEHPAVAESAVVSSPDNVRGEVVKAFVVLTQSHKALNENQLRKDLQDHVKSVTAPYKYPRKVEFVDSLPKTVSGKIRRNVLRDEEWEK